MSIKLIIDSDLHFEKKGIRPDKENHLGKIGTLTDIDAMICSGDLTNNGWDGKSTLGWYYGGTEDEVTPLKNFINFIETDYKIPVYICDGNHDQYVPWPYLHKAVRNYIEKKHGNLLYSWDLKGYHFICMSVYPNADRLEFLKKDLEKNKDKPIIIYFHYCLTGAWSDWWKDSEKIAFYNTIKDYKIRLIIVGHRHSNWLDSWNGIPVASGAGDKLVICTITPDDISIEQI